MELIRGVVKEGIVQTEMHKDSEMVKGLVEFAVNYTGKEITKEGKDCIRVLSKVVKDDDFVAAYFFYRVLLSTSQPLNCRVQGEREDG